MPTKPTADPTARAIEIAAASATEFGYQHVLTANSDHVHWSEFTDRAIFDDAIVLRLHDGDTAGSILGQRLHFSIHAEEG